MPRKYLVDISDLALRDLIRIGEYIKKDSPLQAEAFVDEFALKALSLELFPLRGPIIRLAKGKIRQYRHLMHDKYRIIFRVEGRKVRVVRVVHGSQMVKLP